MKDLTLLPLSVWLVVAAAGVLGVAVYATAEPQLPLPLPADAQPADGEGLIVFGARAIARPKTTQTTIANAQLIGRQRARRPTADVTADAGTGIAASRADGRQTPQITRRYDAPERPAEQQLVRQYDVPIVRKTVDAAAAPKGQRQRSRASAATTGGSQRSHGNVRQEQQQQQQRRQQGTAAAAAAPATADERRNTNRDEARRGDASGARPPKANAAAHNSRKPIPTITATTTTTSTTSPLANPFGNIQINNPFEAISQNIWNFLNPPASPQAAQAPVATTTRRPPKKYTPATAAALTTPKQEKLTYQKETAKPTKPPPPSPPPSPPTPPTSTKKSATTDGPFRIALPTINFFNAPTQRAAPTAEGDKGKRDAVAMLRERFICPRESEVRFQLFPKICKTDKDCSVWNREELCCEIFGAKSCVSGVPKPLEESSHMPILGLIPRKCPTRPLAELWWEVKECETDSDCWPRVCCPDGRRRYCRTSQPELETVPVPVKRSFNYLSEYLECTAPPPPIFDLHPKACTSTLDCFPNVCCQESGLRHCRPPKKSVLTLMANVLNVDFVKRLTQNIVIK